MNSSMPTANGFPSIANHIVDKAPKSNHITSRITENFMDVGFTDKARGRWRP